MFALQYFGVLLPLLADLTNFPDRRFSGPWWNAADLQTFWRDWNTGVYMWARRHIFEPCVHGRATAPRRALAAAAVFLASAFLHEFVVSAAAGTLRSEALVAMAAQGPAAWATGRLRMWARRGRVSGAGPASDAGPAAHPRGGPAAHSRGGPEVHHHPCGALLPPATRAAAARLAGNAAMWVSLLAAQPMLMRIYHDAWLRQNTPV
jgi:hypothetical protein